MRRATVSMVAVLVLCAACSSDEQAAPSALPSVGAPASPSAVSPSPPAAPSMTPNATPEPASPSPSPEPVEGGEGQGGVVLGGTKLGVTALGTDFSTAVQRISAVLGEPSENPKTSVSCINAIGEVAWGEFTVANKDGKLAGWISRSRTLQTPAGVTVGTDVATLKQVYGNGFRLTEANPDNPPGFAVQGVDVRGSLTSLDDSGTVQALFTSACSGP